ncbi:uncharacterized protein EDB91DRAFT_1171256 [Suillus paluster]|uniref:uncharacterized protein n=1 Tax=Suillus paluster TaxID=48578 RepID=UPI001B86CFF5|nr:uncharacterized protein EDB91DRAFT_1171256 [Suillus paluster]KAG1724301.1 hypothetical protein EDB91DRAFT_1171256 [Suillus paluster]
MVVYGRLSASTTSAKPTKNNYPKGVKTHTIHYPSRTSTLAAQIDVPTFQASLSAVVDEMRSLARATRPFLPSGKRFSSVPNGVRLELWVVGGIEVLPVGYVFKLPAVYTFEILSVMRDLELLNIGIELELSGGGLCTALRGRGWLLAVRIRLAVTAGAIVLASICNTSRRLAGLAHCVLCPALRTRLLLFHFVPGAVANDEWWGEEPGRDSSVEDPFIGKGKVGKEPRAEEGAFLLGL